MNKTENVTGKKFKNIVITSFNNRRDFFQRGQVLISSLHKTSFNTIDRIFVYNLGLNESLVKLLKSYEKVVVLEFPEYLNDIYEGFLSPGEFAWKCFAIRDAARLADNVLWMDAGIAALKDLKCIYDIIEKEDIFLVDLPWFSNKDWTHEKCLQLMNATEEERNGPQISTNIMGYKVNGKYDFIFDEAFEYSKIKELIQGPGSIHRHEQSLYAILSIRHNCKRYPIETFAEWRGILHEDQVCWGHRGAWTNKKSLRRIKNELNLNDYFYIASNNIRINSKIILKKIAKKFIR